MKQAHRKGSPADVEKKAQKLLQHHGCPTPWPTVRTLFLGQIASPLVFVSPIGALKGLFGGELPTFDNLDDLNHLLDIVVNGLWNSLTRHEKRSEPFRLERRVVEVSTAGLREISEMRQDELSGFVDGLFQNCDSIELPARAADGLEVLMELESFFFAIIDVIDRGTKPSASGEITTSLNHVREMTRIAELEIHEIVMACVRARRNQDESWPVDRPNLH